MRIRIPSQLSDFELVAEVKRLARCERTATAGLIAHLAELDARRLYLSAGYSSLFAYCTGVLHLSEHGTFNRIEAARAVRSFPLILEMLTAGSLNLATVRLLAPHLTSENHRELLLAASGRSKREVEVLLAGHFPRPAVPPMVRRLPVRTAPAPLLSASRPSQDSVVAAPVLVPRSARPTATPLAPDRYQIRFTANAETYGKLRQVQDLLGHSVPDGDLAAIFERALNVLLDDLTRKKLAHTARPRVARTTKPRSRHIPAEVRRSVWRRDGGQCAFVAGSGQRCTARRLLEFHHVRPYGARGEATFANIELRCQAHNGYEAELFYGASRSRELAPGRVHTLTSPRSVSRRS